MAEIAIITVRDLSTDRRPPLPSELLASFVVFGALGLLARPAPAAASLTGWGLVIATLLSSQVDVLAPVGKFLAGGNATPDPTDKAPLPGLGGGIPYGAPGFPARPGDPTGTGGGRVTRSWAGGRSWS